MNAGTKDSTIGGLLEWVGVFDVNLNDYVQMHADDLDFRYRYSPFQGQESLLVIDAQLALRRGDSREIKAQMKAQKSLRWSKQPRNYPNCGSVFKRPEGKFVGPMIESLGFKGFQIGGAQVSKHAGFIVNAGDATGADILNLVETIQQRVHQEFGVSLSWAASHMTFDSSSYLKNISRIGAGNFLVKLIGLGATPFISRLYLPEHFGELSYVVSVVSVLGVFSTLRLSEAVAVERNIDRRKALIQASFVLVFLVALAGPGFTLLVDPGMSLELAVVVGILLATKGVCEVMVGLAINQKAYGTIATTRVRQSIYSTAAKVLVGLSITSYGLLIGQMALDSGGIVVLAEGFKSTFDREYYQEKTCFQALLYTRRLFYTLPSQAI